MALPGGRNPGYEAPPTYYYGRRWDAPIYDDAIQGDQEFLATMLEQMPNVCSLCEEGLGVHDDILLTPYMSTHLECMLRSGMGDVQHLEQRCLCFKGSGNEITYGSDVYESYRESAKAAMQWLLDNGKGRFHE